MDLHEQCVSVLFLLCCGLNKSVVLLLTELYVPGTRMLFVLFVGDKVKPG